MKDTWYGDHRDLVKWGTLAHLAQRHALAAIVQVAYLRPGKRPLLHDGRAEVPISPAVWAFFRDPGAVRGLAGTLKCRIVPLHDTFVPRQRKQYREKIIEAVRAVEGAKIVLLDPDTGIAASRATGKHVTTEDMTAVWQVLASGDWLAVYQHRYRDKCWREKARAKLAAVCGTSVELFSAPDVASDVVFLAAQRPLTKPQEPQCGLPKAAQAILEQPQAKAKVDDWIRIGRREGQVEGDQHGRRDHFSPQGYLRGFIHPARLDAQKPLWVFSVERQEWKEQSTAAFGWKRGLYDDPADSAASVAAEEVFLRPEIDFPAVREKIRSEGFMSWSRYRDPLVQFAAMLSARSPMFLAQAAGSIRGALSVLPDPDVLARNYGIAAMRSEVEKRSRRWKDLFWVLRFTRHPESPVIGCDQSVGMDGQVHVRVALQDYRTTLFFPVSWDMCLFGSPAKLEPECAEFLEPDLRRLRALVAKQAQVFVVSPVQLEGLGG